MTMRAKIDGIYLRVVENVEATCDGCGKVVELPWESNGREIEEIYDGKRRGMFIRRVKGELDLCGDCIPKDDPRLLGTDDADQ